MTKRPVRASRRRANIPPDVFTARKAQEEIAALPKPDPRSPTFLAERAALVKRKQEIMARARQEAGLETSLSSVLTQKFGRERNLTPKLRGFGAGANADATYQAGDVPDNYVYPLTLVPGAAAAYSVARALNSAYTGSAIRLRRSSDNAESDFGFLDNVLDTAAITTWLGGANGFIKTLYDQSGNGQDMSQATTANQPLYVASAKNGRAGMLLNGTSQFVASADLGAALSGSDIAMSVLAVSQPTNITSNRMVFALGNTANNLDYHLIDYFSTGPVFRSGRRSGGAGDKSISGGTPVGEDWHVWRYTFTGTLANLFANGTRIGSENTDQDVAPVVVNTAAIGALNRATPASFMLGHICEVMVWASALSAANALTLDTDQNTFYAIY